MDRLAAIIYTFFLVSCEEPASKFEDDPWDGFTEHEKIFDCMYSGVMDCLPESVHPVEDYTLILKGHWESPQSVPEISAVIARKEDRAIKTAIGLKAVEELFTTIEPKSTIRRYYKCTVPLTYNVPQEQVDQAEALIPEGLIWHADVARNVVCTCPKG